MKLIVCVIIGWFYNFVFIIQVEFYDGYERFFFGIYFQELYDVRVVKFFYYISFIEEVNLTRNVGQDINQCECSLCKNYSNNLNEMCLKGSNFVYKLYINGYKMC